MFSNIKDVVAYLSTKIKFATGVRAIEAWLIARKERERKKQTKRRESWLK
jgi:hypothetical protein